MLDPARLYTAAEAGAVSGLKLKAVHNAIDKHIVEPAGKGRAIGAGGPTRSRYLTGLDMVRLCVWRGVGDTLSTDRRRRLFEAIDVAPRARTVRADELLIVDVGEARKQVARGMRELAAAEAIVVRDSAVLGGEPVFKGTRIPVHAIAAMLDADASEEDLLSGYPAVTRRMLGLARLWAAAHPRRGRPRSLSRLGLEPVASRRAPRKADPLGPRTQPAGPVAG